jgi:hypothetical protein
VFKAKWGFF